MHGADHSFGLVGGVGFQQAANQTEGANKAPYCPPLPFEDGVNWERKDKGPCFLVGGGGGGGGGGQHSRTTGCDKITLSGLDYRRGFTITPGSLEGGVDQLCLSWTFLISQFIQKKLQIQSLQPVFFSDSTTSNQLY